MASVEDIKFLFDAESLGRVLNAPIGGKLCETIQNLCASKRIYACRRCFKEVLGAFDTPVCAVIGSWGFVLLDHDERVEVEMARLAANLNPKYQQRASTYEFKLMVVAKARLHGCLLISDDISVSASSMMNICNDLSFEYEAFDDRFGNLQ